MLSVNVFSTKLVFNYQQNILAMSNMQKSGCVTSRDLKFV